MKVIAHRNVVMLDLASHPAHRVVNGQYAVLTLKEAHEAVKALCEAIGNAQGHQDVMDGKMPDTVDCPNCKARNMTASHVCKRVKARKR